MLDELLGAIGRALAQAASDLSWVDLLGILGAYVATPVIVFIHLQFMKFDRRERNARELGRWELRGLAFIGCFMLSAFIGWRLAGWPLARAVDHAFTVAVAYPFLMWVYMAWLKKKNPEAYRKLTAQRRREGESPAGNGDETMVSTDI